MEDRYFYSWTSHNRIIIWDHFTVNIQLYFKFLKRLLI